MEKQFIKQNVIKTLGGTKAAANFWNIEPQAIYQWPDDKEIPEKRRLQCLLNRPDLFRLVT